MKQRLAETYGVGGLVIAPQERGCIGEQCWFEKCWADEHHLYFNEDDYKHHPDDVIRPIADEFRRLSANQIKLARCAHLIIHKTVSGVPVPHADLMVEYIKEAHLLEEYGVKVSSLIDLEAMLWHDLPNGRDDWNELVRTRGTEFVSSLWDLQHEDQRMRAEEARLAQVADIEEMRRRLANREVLPDEVIKRTERKLRRRFVAKSAGGLVLPAFEYLKAS